MTESHFAGFHSPRYTQVPNELFDTLLPDLSGAELKVLLYITRRTFGFRKREDEISIAQMCEGLTTAEGRVKDRGTGLSRAGVLAALSSLEDKGVIVRERRTDESGRKSESTYGLKFAPDDDGKEGGVGPDFRPRVGPESGRGKVQTLDLGRSRNQDPLPIRQKKDVLETKRESASLQNQSINSAETLEEIRTPRAERERIEDLALDLFKAYCRGVGIRFLELGLTPGMTKSLSFLRPQADCLEPAKLEAMSRWFLEESHKRGKRGVPAVEWILEQESAFDRRNEQTELALPVQTIRRSGGAAAGGLTPAELRARARQLAEGEM